MVDPKNVHSMIGKHMLADGMEQVIDLNKSHGSWLVDARDGKEYLDLFSMFASMPIGYNHPLLLENKERLIAPTLNKITNSDIYSTEMAEFVSTMGRIAQPDYLPYAFYVEGGALAVENALKAAFDWKVRKNLAAGIGEKGSKIIHFKECFHGRTGYTMSMTDSPDPRKTMYYPQFDWPRIDNPTINFPLDEESLNKVIQAENTAVDQILEALDKNKNEIAGLIIEPIQGEGGDNHFRCEFFQQLRQLADEHEFLLIYDEVQTGAGITGSMWAHQQFNPNKCNCDCNNANTQPDIISFGKKTQVCGIFAGKKLDEVENNVFHESSRLNSTWGGNIVDMVRITIYLEIIAKEKLVENASLNGHYLLKKLQGIQEEYSDIISNARGRGLFAAFDLQDSEQRDSLVNLIISEGALILGSGKKSIRFRPHLTISKEEIDLADQIIRRAIARL
jgi:L-lysine 6-transaminase|tara:strand:- start:5749 stop:7092 length:1344 start_codon:yes stop_codon:yes gene_type:complete